MDTRRYNTEKRDHGDVFWLASLECYGRRLMLKVEFVFHLFLKNERKLIMRACRCSGPRNTQLGRAAIK